MTTNQKTKKEIKKARTIKWVLIIIKYILMLTPLVTLCIINREEYFYSYSGWKVSIGFIIAAIAGILMATGESKYLKGITAYILFFVVAFLLDSIVQDLKYIALCLLIGKAISLIFNYPITYYSKILNAYVNGGITAQVFKNAKEEATEGE